MAGNKKLIPNCLKKHRRLMGFSQEEIKKHLKLKSTSMISRWEHGQSMPNGRNLLKLSVLYKTLVNDLYYSLSKELQTELFSAEAEAKKKNKEKFKGRTARGP